MKNIFLDSNWQTKHYQEITIKADKRYTPELNVELPITGFFDALGRTTTFYSEFRGHFGELSRRSHGLTPRENADLLEGKDKLLLEDINKLLELLAPIKDYDHVVIPWDKIKSKAEEVMELIWNYRQAVRKAQENDKKQKQPDGRLLSTYSNLFNSELYYISEIQREISYFTNLAGYKKAELTNIPFLSLKGESGIGKTHLLCDLVKLRFEKD
jgi:hypothetical protein